MKHVRWQFVLSLLLVCVAFARSERTPYVAPDQFDLQALLGDPPAENSPEHKAEVDRLLDLQASRTPAEEHRCKDEEEVTVFAFATVLGDSFSEQNLPLTGKLMADANDDLKGIVSMGKKKWGRVRPPLADPRIHPCVVLEHTASYPSGHATRGMMWATLLSEIFPDKRDALMTRGRQIGDDRFLAGMHYPSDVAAGQKLGEAVAKKMLQNDAFRTELEKAKQECQIQMAHK